METILAFMTMNALLAILMAVFAFRMQRSSASRSTIAAVAVTPLLCWAVWAASQSQSDAGAQMAGMASSPVVQFTGALAAQR